MRITRHDMIAARAVLDLATDSDDSTVPELLHDLTARVITLLTVRAAGVTVLDEAGQLGHLTASDDICRQLEEDQLELGEGPGVDSTRTGTVLAPVTLHHSGPTFQRWPRFVPRALRAGVTCVAAVPLRTRRRTCGALDLMSAAPIPTRQDMCLARMLADAAGLRLDRRQVLLAKDEVIAQLRTALETRIVIEQAKGVLAERLGTDVEEAFARLRRHARSRRNRLSDLAALVAQGLVPAGLDASP
ncbi:transcriptional regulator [Streptomyces ruber]|uniref:Transcriptional regulator n=2 Tax=Streptomyces TaxID=1883 RepID=A0A918BEL4_9ACTN|nr:GAF and ANTAR domain-containing protein [Streptomyces ruber]GGQ61350.1 transcriptional regulator [Streptomyces ruber]